MHNFIYTYIYVCIHRQTGDSHSLTHTVTYKQITDNVHVLPAHHGESVSVWHCIDDVFSGAKNVLLHPNAHSLYIIIITLSSRCWCRAPVSPGCPAKSLLLVWSKAMELHGVWGDRKKEKLQLKALCKTRSMDFLWRRYPSPSLTTHLQSLHTRHEFKHEEKTKIFTSIAATNHQNFKIN